MNFELGVKNAYLSLIFLLSLSYTRCASSPTFLRHILGCASSPTFLRHILGCASSPTFLRYILGCASSPTFLRHILGCASSPTFLRLSFAEPSLKVWQILNCELGGI